MDQPAQPPVSPTSSKKKILIIEDDPLLVKMYSTKFESEGFEVISAHDGETGLKMATETIPSLIILDIMMPKLSGLDLLKKLKANPKGKNIPVIILSNLSKEEDAKNALSLGAKEYLIKASLTPAQVVAKAKSHLQ